MKTILLLDSNTGRRALYARILSKGGYRVADAASGEEALGWLEHNRPELVVVDSELSDMTGVDFLQAISQRGHAPLVVYLSSVFQTDAGAYARLTDELGVTLVLHKPIAPLEFRVHVDNLVAAEPVTSLAEDSAIEEHIRKIRATFFVRLEADLAALAERLSNAHAPTTLMPPIHAARRIARSLQGLASRHGYFDIGQAVGGLVATLDDLLVIPPTEHARVWSNVDAALSRTRDLADQARRARLGRSAEAARARPADDRATATIVLVGAEADFAARAEQLAEQLLVRVEVARDHDHALALLEDGHRNVEGIFVTIDAERPGQAYAFVRQLRDDTRFAQLPLAFVSDSDRVRDRVHAAHAGATLFLEKPVDGSEFSRAVHHLVALHRADRPEILLVDDDQGFADEMATWLTEASMGLSHITESADLLTELERCNPDALVLNALLPGISGFDLCRMLRTTPRWQDLPILFVAERDGPDARIAAFRAGGDDYLAKPVAREEFMARIGARIERTRLLRERADRDVLTGLLTRRAFVETLAARLSEVRRQSVPLSFCLLDLDEFKAVNDTYGHVAGDRVLAAVGRLLQSRFRFEDLRGRWGGEEFAIAMVGEPAETARRVLERVLNEFRRLEFTGADGEAFQVTFSAGVAGFPDDGHDTETLVAVADRRLYAAKQKGRNRIVCQESSP